jgi:hypothetical protein
MMGGTGITLEPWLERLTGAMCFDFEAVQTSGRFWKDCKNEERGKGPIFESASSNQLMMILLTH